MSSEASEPSYEVAKFLIDEDEWELIDTVETYREAEAIALEEAARRDPNVATVRIKGPRDLYMAVDLTSD